MRFDSRPKMRENVFAAGVLPGPRWGSLQRSSRPLSWIQGGKGVEKGKGKGRGVEGERGEREETGG